VADCPEAPSATGKLHVVVRVDFTRGTAVPELGRGQTLAAGDALVACAKSALADVKLAGVAHDNPRYSVAYAMTFGDESGNAASAAAPSPHAAPARDAPEETADVVWDVAIVRDAPKTGKVLARLQRGTSVRIGVSKDGWYPVKYGDNFASDGWLYRGAIGR
jgi:hypothetical protein